MVTFQVKVLKKDLDDSRWSGVLVTFVSFESLVVKWQKMRHVWLARMCKWLFVIGARVLSYIARGDGCFSFLLFQSIQTPLDQIEVKTPSGSKADEFNPEFIGIGFGEC